MASTPEASEAAGFDVRLPDALGVPNQLTVEPGAQVNLRVDLPRVREFLRELGRSDIALPGDVDGAEVRMAIRSGVRAEYGDSSRQVVFIQIPSPQVTAPPDLPMDRIGEAVLQVFGMTSEEAVQFSRSVDWSTTLVVPVPRDQADHEEVVVDGVPGTLIHRKSGQSPAFFLVWVRDGIIYALNGPGTPPAISMTSLPRVAERPVADGVRLSPSPNPSRGTVAIGYAIPAEAGEGPTTLDIYDVTGRRLVRYDLPGTTREGTVSWNGTDDRGVAVAPGIYYARLSAGKVVATSRISRAR